MKIVKLMLASAIALLMVACGENAPKQTEVKPEATTTTTTVHPDESGKPAETETQTTPANP